MARSVAFGLVSLRDSFFLRHGGDDPGPAGRLLVAWRELDRSAPLPRFCHSGLADAVLAARLSWPRDLSVGQIAAEAGVCVRTVQNAEAEAMRQGYLARRSASGKGRRTTPTSFGSHQPSGSPGSSTVR